MGVFLLVDLCSVTSNVTLPKNKGMFMIKSFSDKTLENCWRYGNCHQIKQDLKRRILIKLDLMDAATCIDDLKNVPGNHLHQLQGNYQGYLSIAVNGPWRLIFIIDNGNIYNIKLMQYH